MKNRVLLMSVVLGAGVVVSCRSSGQKKETAEMRETSRLGALNPEAELGGYYRLKSSVSGFYFNIPNFTDVLPNRYLMRGHVVQLLDPSAGDGWARVKNEQLQIGYTKFENLRIVPADQQPRPRAQSMDAELDQNMRLE